MNQYLKDFLLSYKEWNMQSCANEDQFIAEYLKDHPLPLPTEEEICLASLDELEEDSIEAFIRIKYWMRGVMWLSKKIQESLK